LGLGIAFAIFTPLLGAIPPLMMRYLIDKVLVGSRHQQLAVVVAIVAALPVTIAIFTVTNRLVVGILGQRIIIDLRTALYRHVLTLSMKFHSEMGAGPVMNHLMTDVGIVQTLITGETLGILSSSVVLFTSLGFAFAIKWQLAVIILFIMLIYAASYYQFAQRIRSANLELREIMDMVTGRLQERLAGVRLVKTYCRERDELADFLASTDRALQFGMRNQMLQVTLNSTTRLIAGIGSTIVYSWAAWYVLHRHMTYGDMQAMDNFFWQAAWPAINLTMVAGQVTQAMVSLDRIMKLTHQTPDIVERPQAYDLPESRGDLRLENVDFAYDAGHPLFTGLNLHLPAGKMTALVGHTGCGKTTVTSLLMRLWDVQGGAVTLDGHDVRDLTLRSLRAHMGVVPQEPVVFEGTVFYNIAYAMPEATQEQVEEAARAAQIHDHILSLSNGYQSWLGKEGDKLSVGQKQRIAIARAILSKPAVLILDEATSALDSESEAAMQEAMRVVLHGRTSVVVAHRLSTIVEAEQIVAMDRGEIVEIGTHDELMQIEGGLYRRLYDELKGKHEQGGVA